MNRQIAIQRTAPLAVPVSLYNDICYKDAVSAFCAGLVVVFRAPVCPRRYAQSVAIRPQHHRRAARSGIDGTDKAVDQLPADIGHRDPQKTSPPDQEPPLPGDVPETQTAARVIIIRVLPP